MFKVIWDRENNGVRLTMSPPSGEALNICPRPVFWEELDFYKLRDFGWTYPNCDSPLLWACERRYYYKGELVLEINGGNLFDLPRVKVIKTNLNLEEVNLAQLKKVNEDSMFLIEHEAMSYIYQTFLSHVISKSNNNVGVSFDKLLEEIQSRTSVEQTVIREECGSFDIMPLSEAEKLGKQRIFNSNIEKVLVSFSGGKDSQVVLDLACRVLPPSKFLVIYSNTGYELPTSLSLYTEIKDYYTQKYPDLQFYTAENHKNVLQYWDELDTPSKVHRWCCAVMKTAPLYRLLKEIHGTGKQPNVLAFEGVRAEESSKRATYSRIGKGVKHNNVVNVRPIFEWTTTEVWLYILLNNMPINVAYRKGLNRVGCVICPLSSELGDCLDNHFFPQTAKPFVDKLRENATNAGIKNIDSYLKERKWKVRAGGNRHYTDTEINYEEKDNDLYIHIKSPKENFFEWIKVLGKLQIENLSEQKYRLHINCKNKVYLLSVDIQGSSVDIFIKDCLTDIVFISLIKRIFNKSAYCVHCEVCEVECPTGALSVVPKVSIDENKCIHCHKCLTFKDDGCVAANSVRTTLTTNTKLGTMTPINKINTFGFRKKWVQVLYELKNNFFNSDRHGLNVKKQLPIFVNWLRDAELLDPKDKKLSVLAEKLETTFSSEENVFWEIAWINLCINSEICNWFNSCVKYDLLYSREEIGILLENSFPNATINVRDNVLKALLNTFKESPLGDPLRVGVVIKDGNKTSVIRRPHNELSLVAAAYSLYRYAEKTGRYSLTVSEFYDPEQKDGIVKQFGIKREPFEQILRSLEQDANHVLRAELKMGLDNIILREDLKSDDIINLML